MGMKLAWLAIKTNNCAYIDEMLELSNMTMLGIPQQAQNEEYYSGDRFDPLSRIQSTLTKNGWYFLDFRYIPESVEEQIPVLSIGTTAVKFWLNETVMYSSAECWVDGELIWSVNHGDDDVGVMHLEEYGALPDSFDAIKATVFAEQISFNDADYIIEIPALVAKAAIGYKHDEGFTNDDEFLEATESVLSRKKPWLLMKQYT